MKILFSFFTLANRGHDIQSFDAFDKNGKSAFDQAIEYAQQTYNSPGDDVRVFLLTEIPIATPAMHTPATWESMLNIEIINPDGWRRSSQLGEKSMTVRITEAEFRTRCNESTIRQQDLKKL